MLNVQIALPSANAPRTKRFEVVIDSGASRCLFHSDLAANLGIDPKSCQTEITVGIGGHEKTFLHQLTLYIPGGPVTIKAGFKDETPGCWLAGDEWIFRTFQGYFRSN
jgi:hypothetical protein